MFQYIQEGVYRLEALSACAVAVRVRWRCVRVCVRCADLLGVHARVHAAQAADAVASQRARAGSAAREGGGGAPAVGGQPLQPLSVQRSKKCES